MAFTELMRAFMVAALKQTSIEHFYNLFNNCLGSSAEKMPVSMSNVYSLAIEEFCFVHAQLYRGCYLSILTIFSECSSSLHSNLYLESFLNC